MAGTEKRPLNRTEKHFLVRLKGPFPRPGQIQNRVLCGGGQGWPKATALAARSVLDARRITRDTTKAGPLLRQHKLLNPSALNQMLLQHRIHSLERVQPVPDPLGVKHRTWPQLAPVQTARLVYPHPFYPQLLHPRLHIIADFFTPLAGAAAALMPIRPAVAAHKNMRLEIRRRITFQSLTQSCYSTPIRPI